jgi:hypothetical protein
LICDYFLGVQVGFAMNGATQGDPQPFEATAADQPEAGKRNSQTLIRITALGFQCHHSSLELIRLALPGHSQPFYRLQKAEERLLQLVIPDSIAVPATPVESTHDVVNVPRVLKLHGPNGLSGYIEQQALKQIFG